jgi:hypothetical protein
MVTNDLFSGYAYSLPDWVPNLLHDVYGKQNIFGETLLKINDF